MTLPREAWPRLKEAFEGARALALDARPAYLAEVCNGDEALRREVELLLAHHDQAASFLETPAMPFDDSRAAESLEGRCIGPYRVSALIGKGGMGEVYRAHDAKLGRDVAIKVLPSIFTADRERVARFDSEARMLAALNHPHIGAIYGLEEAGGMPALVLELVDGETLADRLRRGPVPTGDALAIARQIADALDAAHRKRITHRDLKPANIKVTPDGRVKVLDFGLAKALASDVTATQGISQSPTAAIDATHVGVILGTAAYMSPEQARGLPVDTRADIWSFGCVLYKCSRGGLLSRGRRSPRPWQPFSNGSPTGRRCPPRRRRGSGSSCATACRGILLSGCRTSQKPATCSTRRSADGTRGELPQSQP